MATLIITLSNIKQDFERRVQLERCEGLLHKLVLLIKPGMIGAICYRFSHYFAQGKLRFLCRILLLIEHGYCRNEISPYAQIGPGLVLGDIGAIGMTGEVVVGENCTFQGFNVLTLNGITGVDFTKDKIILGNHCLLGTRAKIMRPVSISDGTQVTNNSLVMSSVTKVGSTLSGVPAKRLRIDDYDAIKNWNPLMGGFLKHSE
jgi:serine O-acetyltransferase